MAEHRGSTAINRRNPEMRWLGTWVCTVLPYLPSGTCMLSHPSWPTRPEVNSVLLPHPTSTMPLEARHCPRSKAELERRIREAVSVLERASENGEILSVCSSTPTQVPRATLQLRIDGPSRPETLASGQPMTDDEEKSFVQWIIALDRRGAPPKHLFSEQRIISRAGMNIRLCPTTG